MSAKTKKREEKKKGKSCENTRSPWLEPDEVWPVLYFFIWNDETTMEKWSVSNKRWKAAGSRALFSSELVPASMMSIRRRVKWEVKWEAGEDGGGPASEGGCVRRIPKRKRTCRHGGGQKKKTSPVLGRCSPTAAISKEDGCLPHLLVFSVVYLRYHQERSSFNSLHHGHCWKCVWQRLGSSESSTVFLGNFVSKGQVQEWV